MSVKITRPTVIEYHRIAAPEAMIDVRILDTDGAPLTTLRKRAWSVCGVATIDLMAIPRPVIVKDGAPAVVLMTGELSGIRAQGKTRYWLGIE